MNFAGLSFPPKSPPARARHCTLVGGYMRKESNKLLWGGCQVQLGTAPRQPSRAAVGSISYIAAFAWCPTVCRGTDDCGEHHPSPVAAPALAPGATRHLGRLCRRKGIPRVRRGVGYVGAWRFARPLKSHRGYLPVGEASGQNLPVGPPLGALRRCLRGANAPRPRLPTALWGIQEGKADVTRCETGASRTSCGPRGPSARLQ
jgi:hypothetical protein